jgi:hypothetical protein
MSTRGGAAVAEAEPELPAAGEPCETAPSADSASGAGPRRTSSDDRGSSWKIDESDDACHDRHSAGRQACRGDARGRLAENDHVLAVDEQLRPPTRAGPG